MRSSLPRRNDGVLATRGADGGDSRYRSNTSLELMYSDRGGGGLRREYGSHGSIDVLGGASGPAEDYVPTINPVNQSASTPNFARAVQFRPVKPEDSASERVDGQTPAKIKSSPKLRLKFTSKFWSNGHNLSKVTLDDTAIAMPATTESFSQLSVEAEERNKRKGFAHYDCQSLMANLGYSATLRSVLLSRRRNTTTGASAASLLQRGVDQAAAGDAGTDAGDGRSNDLIESCPFFRNEIGGEEERRVSLCWRTSRSGRSDRREVSTSRHRPAASYGLSVLEFPPGQSHWRDPCPFSTTTHSLLPIETQDHGASYYKKYFLGKEHQNWFGMDENLGPVAISIRKEKIELPVTSPTGVPSPPGGNLVSQYRLIIRTSELLTLRGSILEDAIPNIKQPNSKNYNTKDVFEYVVPEIQLSCLRLGLTGSGAEEQLLRLDEQCVTRQYKVGVMYCGPGQATEEEMYNNKEASEAFVEFLQTLGQTVRLKGFDKYKGGLDTKSDSTGTYSVYTKYRDCDIMFHVSTMLPYTPNNRQQLLRKRHIGNDIVTIVFQEAGAQAFTPKHIRSQFQHVFIVVRAINPNTDNTHYSIAVSRSKEVPIFGPPLKDGAIYPKGEAFTDLLLSKVINGENAAIQSPKFSTMATRTRYEYLKDLAKNYVTATALDAGQKFSIFSSLLMKSSSTQSASGLGRSGSRDSCSLGAGTGVSALTAAALCYHVAVQDEGAGGVSIDCILGVSTDTVVFIEEMSRQIVLVIPTKLLLGWVVCGGGWTRIYYHRGECVCVRGGGDALLRRLAGVAPGAGPLAETVLDREPSGKLGFNVQSDGLVTEVACGGAAAGAGLRRGVRLLEVCRAAVVTMQYDQLIDLLKTSYPVTVTMTSADTPRCECVARCDCRGAGEEEPPPPGRANAQLPGGQRRMYDRSFSPPRSSDSSGYGTGGSARSGRRSPEPPEPEPPPPPTRRLEDAPSPRRDDPAPSPRRATPKRLSLRPQSGAGSLQEELMRLIGPESVSPHVTTTARPAAVVSPAPPPPPLPLPDASSMDWPALVHTATRAMLQMCEEHQYPSIETCAESTASDTPTPDNHESWRDLQVSDGVGGGGGACECGLRGRVAALEAELAACARGARDLEGEVRRLRAHNARLRDESARAVRQLRHFTQWFMHTVDRQ